MKSFCPKDGKNEKNNRNVKKIFFITFFSLILRISLKPDFMLRNLFIFILLCLVNTLFAQEKSEIFMADFSPEGRNVFSSGEKKSGRLYLGIGNSYNIATIFKPLNCKKYKISADIRFENGLQTRCYGLIFESSGVENSNVFLVSASGYFMTGCFDGGRFTEISSWQETEYFRKGFDNRLEIVRDNSLTYFYINEHLVFSTSRIQNFGFQHGYISKENTEVSSGFFRIETEKEKYVFDSPKKMLSSVNSKYPEIAPLESDDGKVLYFSRIDAPENYGKDDDCDIWFAQKERGVFFSPVHFPYKVNSPLVNAVIKTADNNHTLYIEGLYDENGNQTSSNGISITKKMSDQYWTKPEPVEIANFYNRNRHGTYSFSPDLQVLILSVERDGGFGGLDLYISFLLPDGSYSEPKNLGKPLNTELDDGTPFFSPDGKMLYFSSYGHKGFGSSDIFVSKRLSDDFLQWSEPDNLGSMVNSKNWEAYFSISSDFKTAYFVSNDNADFDENIYSILLPEVLEPRKDVFVTLRVVDKVSKETVNAVVSLKSADQTEKIQHKKGTYVINTGGLECTIDISCQNYKSVSVAFERGISSDSTLTVELLPVRYSLKTISFDFQAAFLPFDKYPELDKLAEFLHENPGFTVLLCGHTERGDTEFSRKLALSRANSVKKYLVDMGVEPKRIRCKGFSGTQPLTYGVSESERALNRRVEVYLTAP